MSYIFSLTIICDMTKQDSQIWHYKAVGDWFASRVSAFPPFFASNLVKGALQSNFDFLQNNIFGYSNNYAK